jgi:hypothetical protein
VHAFVDGYHLGLLVTILLLAAGVVVGYVTLRPRAGAPAAPTSEINEVEAVGESLGELVIADELPCGMIGPGPGLARS